MRRNNLVLASAMALAITGGSVGIANAQDRQPVTIDVAKACGVVTLTFVNPNTDVAKIQGFTWNAVNGNVATAVGKRTGDVTVGPTKTVKETITFPEDEFGGVGAVTVLPTFGPDTDIQPRLDIYPVDTDCKPPTETPPPTTEKPDPTEEPTTPPPPPTSTTVPPPPVTNQPPVTTQEPAPNPPVVIPPPVVNNNTVNNNTPQVQNVPKGGVETGDGSLA